MPVTLDRCAPGEKLRTSIFCGAVEVPLLIVRGARPGPVLALTAAVHGDEYEGVRAIFEVFEELDAAVLAGVLVAAPVANPPAFWAGTRMSPLDGANLARVFPGRADGTASEALAHGLGEQVIGGADFYLDLHSGGVGWTMPSMAGYDASDERSRAGAFAFGAPVIWGHPSTPPGRTVSFAKSRGIPFLYTEARGGARVHPDDLAMMKRGIRNLLRHIGAMAGELECSPLRAHLIGDGNIDESILAPADGFFTPAVRILDRVRRGDGAGRLLDIRGETIAELAAPRDGIVGLVRDCPMVHAGEPLLLVTSEA
ncbi:MAG: succinylglutamate desuccinylase/aspartoacylase family protein [Bryobacteraceae bacterium]